MDNPPPVDRVENEAAAWLLRRDSPDWSAQDQAALEAWLQTSPSHQVAYVRLRCAWSKAGRLNSVSGAFTGGKVPARGEIKRLPFFRAKQTTGTAPASRRLPSTRARAAIAAAFVIGSLLISVELWLARDEAFQTPVGGLTSVPMKDGSRVILNTASRLSIHVDDSLRSVNLTRGEAFFDVAKDPHRPFVVNAGNRRIVAVGTQFSVRTSEDGVRVTVSEGLVRVEEGTASRHRTLAHVSAGQIVSLPTEAQAQIHVRQESLERVERSLSWRSGFIMLRSTPLPEAVAEFNRYNTHQLVIADDSLADVLVGGSFKANNIDGFVRLLTEGFRVRATTEGDHTVLTRDSHGR